MGCHIENIRANDWITGIEDLRDCPHHSRMSFDGLPWKVVAISAPFLVCQRNGMTITLDVRAIGVTKCLPAYVKALECINIGEQEQAKPRRKKKPKRDPRDCPRCGQRMIERMSGAREWHVICRDCGYDQGPVEKGNIT